MALFVHNVKEVRNGEGASTNAGLIPVRGLDKVKRQAGHMVVQTPRLVCVSE